MAQDGSLSLGQVVFQAHESWSSRLSYPLRTCPRRGSRVHCSATTMASRRCFLPIRIRGFGSPGPRMETVAPFVSVLSVSVADDGSEQPAALDIVVGRFEVGDPFAESPCAPDESHRTASFSLGTAAFEVGLCTFLGGGETTGYRVIEMTVQDDNDALSPEDREPMVLSDADLEGALQVSWHHHNACDSFVLTTNHASYAATSAAMAGCGTILDDAPQRTFEDPRQTVLYRVRYDAGPWSDVQELDCHHHFLSDCSE